MEKMMTQVEKNLREQRTLWSRVAEHAVKVSSRELPLEAPKRIILFGLGSSFFAAKLTSYALLRDRNRLRIPVMAVSSLGVGSELIPTKGDWAFGLSHRGTSLPTAEALNVCDRAGAFTAWVCGVGAQVPESSRMVLPTVEIEQVEPHTSAVTGAICAITSLVSGARAAEEWNALSSIGDPELDSVRARVGQGPALILGEWEGEWMARESALKLMEMARLPVRAFGSEEFFHGPRFSRRANDSIWHVAVAGDSRSDSIDAACRIEASQATPLSWVPALVQLQWMALAVALNLGVDPDHPERDEKI